MSIPGNTNPLLIKRASAADTGYKITNSLRYNYDDDPKLSRTLGSGGNRNAYTQSIWLKRGLISTEFSTDPRWHIFSLAAACPGGGWEYAAFDNTDRLYWYIFRQSGSWKVAQTNRYFRDPSAWMNIVLIWNGGESDANKAQIWVNGVRETSFATYSMPSGNPDLGIGDNTTHYWGSYGSGEYFDGAITHCAYLEGAHAASNFGEFADNGQWIPKDLSSLTFGNTGFWLKFDNTSSNANLGLDSSGNSNTMTVANIQASDDENTDAWVDSPTNGSGTDSGAGGEEPGNYCSWNQVHRNTGCKVYNGNLQITSWSGAGHGDKRVVFGTHAIPSGDSADKYYYEVKFGGANCTLGVGTKDMSMNNDTQVGQDSNGWGYEPTGTFFHNGSQGSATSCSAGDWVGCAIDFSGSTGVLKWYKNGTEITMTTDQTTTFSNLDLTKTYYPVISTHSPNVTHYTNFGQFPFQDALTGYRCLTTKHFPDTFSGDELNTGTKYFKSTKWTGDGNDRDIDVGFAPDSVLIKNWEQSQGHNEDWWVWTDIVRGATKTLYTNKQDAESTQSDQLTAFNSDGFSIGGHDFVNDNGFRIQGWSWDCGTSTVSGVRANQTAGQSVVTWTGTLNGNTTVNHGLSSAPFLIIVKNRDDDSTNWIVWLEILGDDYYLKLNSSNGKEGSSGNYIDTVTSTSFKPGSNNESNGSGDNMVAYCFAEVAGYSTSGRYKGNGSNTGKFQPCGFKPAWLIIKRDTGGEAWWIKDPACFEEYNPIMFAARPNSDNNAYTNYKVDFYGNGWKVRDSNGAINNPDEHYVWFAFAECPHKVANAK